ncbi:MAG: amidohydrolase family protein [Planctomycetota bacterium]
MSANSLLLSLALAALASAAPAQDVTVVKCGTLWTGRGEQPKTDVVLLIEDGKIKQIGADIEVPWNANVIDASRHFVMPAWVLAHCSGGLDRENENIPMTPYLTVMDSLEPAHPFFEVARRAGIGVLHVLPGNTCQVGGRGVLLKPYGQTPEEMAFVEKAAMKVSLFSGRGSRSAHLLALEKGFQDALDHRKELQRQRKEWEEDKANGATTEAEFDVEAKLDPLKKPLLDMLDGKIPAYIYVHDANDVPTALSLLEKYPLKAVLVLGPRCYKAAALLERWSRRNPGKLRLVLDPELEFTEKDPVTGDETVVCPAKVYWDKGLPFALTSAEVGGRSSGNPALALPWWQVGTCVRYGIPEDDAIAAFTEIPAKILNRGDRVGRIAVGMDATIQVLKAPPMEPESEVDMLLVEGQVVYDRSKDPRVKALTGTSETR